MKRKQFRPPAERKVLKDKLEEKSPPTKGFAPLADYTDEEREFLQACDRRRKKMLQVNRCVLTNTEILEVALSLGYRRLSPEAAAAYDAARAG